MMEDLHDDRTLLDEETSWRPASWAWGLLGVLSALALLAAKSVSAQGIKSMLEAGKAFLPLVVHSYVPGDVPTLVPTPSTTETHTVVPSPSPTVTAFPTPTMTPDPTRMYSPTLTSTPLATATPDPASPTCTPMPETPTPQNTSTATLPSPPTPTLQATPTASLPPSPTPTLQATATLSPPAPPIPTASASPTSTSTFTPEPATATPTATFTAHPAPSATATSAGEPTVEPTETPTGSPPGGNLLVNGDFSDAFNGWSQVNEYWRIHDITGSECSQQNPAWPLTMAEMDRDGCGDCNTWPVGGEDWLWQDVAAPGSHLTVTLTLTEAHHMHSGTAELTLYGGEAGAWQVVFHRPAPEAPYGAGHFCETPPSFTYSLTGGYPNYRLEIHGHLKDPEDGWIIGPLVLTVE